MYRAVTWAALEHNLSPDDEVAVTALVESLTIRVTPPTQDDGRQYTVYADGRDVTWAIRRPEVDAAVSPISAYAGVRRVLTEQQRQVAAGGRIVMVGRDIGTIVLPHADLKIYLDASATERARRRHQEYKTQGGGLNYDDTLGKVMQRDRIDSTRDIAPLRAAADAVIIDSDKLTADEVFVRAWRLCDE